MKRVIEGATHVDPDGNSWIIPQPGHEDGTGLVWVDDLGWCSSEIGDTCIASLTPAWPDEARIEQIGREGNDGLIYQAQPEKYRNDQA